MAKTSRMVYVCCVCHRVGLRPLRCHPGKSGKCDAGMPGDERSMPLVDEHGHLVTRAPKWWVDACCHVKSKAQTKKAK